jgi:citrate lyase beta subunit
MDLEDGVALSEKAVARTCVASALTELNFGRSERLVRLNPVSMSELCRADFDATVSSRPDGYVVPKVEDAAQVQLLAQWLDEAEREYDMPPGGILLIAIIETALGVVRLPEIATSSSRLAALAFGAEDLAGDMGATRTPEGREGFYARSAVVLYAKAYGLQALDTPFVDVRADDALLLTEVHLAQSMGYTGKLAIHPRQVRVIQQAFTPTASQIDRARRLIAEHDQHQASGSGVFTFEGKMVDMPMVRAAETVLQRARAAGVNV